MKVEKVNLEDAKTKFLHRKSLQLAKMFRNAYATLGFEHPITKKLLESYRECRRKIPGDYDPVLGFSTRYGAREAYIETLG